MGRLVTKGFVPPVYPYERLDPFRSVAAALPVGAVDCSVGTPCDPPPEFVVRTLASSRTERAYPSSIGSPAYRQAAAAWMARRFGVDIDPDAQVAACIGTKEFVASLPRYLKLRRPDRDTVLYPAVSYPSYAMGAALAGCRAVPVAVDEHFRIDLGSIERRDAERALCLWVNSPGNPAGALDDLAAAAAWGRDNDVLVASDECYAEFTWDGQPRTILEHGTDGVLAVHSLSKRSNMAGVRAGFYAGDAELVHYLRECRKHAGCMVPGPVQAAAVAAWSDQDHVVAQAARYRRRLDLLAEIAVVAGSNAELPGGAFYLWAPAPGGDAWSFAEMLARRAGLIVSPGEFYCVDPDAAGPLDPHAFVRIAAVQPDDRLELALKRLRAANHH
ncbi:MAG: aminotransferase class I/II-fold pyridoxal phosphate-dependent enzyme [Acidimicrobiaceae bacterium]|nr:aminotransferase class I/II-fold pyridoxal phosphate-dependent enzyme [Acidimicrobiaceae bacterium]MYG99593.1 aminotransferase class I/II-fold pyridoxal phosphate-dependent enzyme [Acidimicrobiaceae bacterium]MYK75984.1 aminotransferase class I/II-fold pyridoxal phosphate-dependent enzyme [Acidimicrobiaceae bacterium]MYL02817.1 aminotransferase class I/II-fold pyridoxal phosphate-dependent enzyme [Acidimicrobiaceae bacterium]